MKDGEKRTKKTAKTVKKASVKKTSPQKAAGKSKTVPKIAAKAAAQSDGRGKATAQSDGRGKAAAQSDGRGKAAAAKSVSKGPVAINFTNPAIGNAFKRAVKKYSNALKRLTD